MARDKRPKPSIALTAILLLFSILWAPLASAGLIIDSNLLYLGNGIKTSADESFSKYSVSGFLGASFSKVLFLGWKTTSYSDSQKGSAGTMKLSGLEMGPRIGCFIGKDRWFIASVSYLPVHKGTHTSDAGVQSTLSGTGYEIEAAFAPEVTSGFSPGFSLIYHLGSYSSSTDAANTTTSVSFSRTAIIPTLYLHWVIGGLD